MPLPLLLIPVIGAIGAYTANKGISNTVASVVSPQQIALSKWITSNPFPQDAYNALTHSAPWDFWQPVNIGMSQDVLKARFDTIYKDNNAQAIQTAIGNNPLLKDAIALNNWLNNYKSFANQNGLQTDVKQLSNLQVVADIGIYEFASHQFPPPINTGFHGFSIGFFGSPDDDNPETKWYSDYNAWASSKGYPTWQEHDTNPLTQYAVKALNIALPGSGTIIYNLASNKI